MSRKPKRGTVEKISLSSHTADYAWVVENFRHCMEQAARAFNNDDVDRQLRANKFSETGDRLERRRPSGWSGEKFQDGSVARNRCHRSG